MAAVAVAMPGPWLSRGGQLGWRGFMTIRWPTGATTSIDFREKAPLAGDGQHVPGQGRQRDQGREHQRPCRRRARLRGLTGYLAGEVRTMKRATSSRLLISLAEQGLRAGPVLRRPSRTRRTHSGRCPPRRRSTCTTATPSSRASTGCKRTWPNTRREIHGTAPTVSPRQGGRGIVASIHRQGKSRAGRPGPVQAARDGAGGMRLLRGFTIAGPRRPQIFRRS